MSVDPRNDEPPKQPSELELIKNKLNEFIEKFNTAENRSKEETNRADNLQKELIQLRNDLPGMADQQAVKRLQAIGIPVDDNGNLIQQQQTTQENKPQQVSTGANDGLPLQNLNLNQIETLAKTASALVQTLTPILQAYGIVPQQEGGDNELLKLKLSTRKNYEKLEYTVMNAIVGEAWDNVMSKYGKALKDVMPTLPTETHEAV